MEKNVMRDRLMNKVLSSGFSNKAYRDITKTIDNSMYGGHLAELLASMNSDEFEQWFREEFIPAAQVQISKISSQYPKEAQNLGLKAAKLIKVASPWDRERFLNAILRKNPEVEVNGKMVKGPRHIGELTPQDINLLHAEGLDDDEIQYYRDKFVKEWLDEEAKKIREEMGDSALAQQDRLSQYVPYHMLDEKQYPIASKFNPVLGFLADTFAPESVAELKDAIKTHREPELLEPALKDAAAGAGSMVLPGILGGKAASWAGKKLAPKIGNWMRGVSKSAQVGPLVGRAVPAAADAVAEGLTDAGIELGRQAASDYYDMDGKNAANVGWTSTSFPALWGMGTAALSQVPGIGRVIAPIMQHSRGVDITPAQMEKAMAEQLVMDAGERVSAMKGTRGNKRAGANVYKREALEKLADFANQHPNRAGFTHQLTADEIEKWLGNKTTRNIDNVTQPLTQDEFNALAGRMTRGTGIESNLAEEAIGRFQKQWPATYKSYAPVSKSTSKIANIAAAAPDVLVNTAARYETAKQRAQGRRNPSEELAYVMENDPNLITQWEMGFKPNTLDPIYEEWRALYGK